MSSHRPSLWRVLSESSRIISAGSRHFLALSVLFIFPVSLASIIYSSALQPTSIHSHYRGFLSYFSTPEPETPPVGKSQLPIRVLYVLFVHLFHICALASITHSTFRGFHGRPVKLISSLKSVLVSFLPLLATTLVTKISMVSIMFAVSIFMLLPYTGLSFLGVNMDYGSAYFLALAILIVALLLVVLTYLHVEWCLTMAVVVVESQWGIAPLKRSSHLVKGTRRIVFLMLLLFGIPSGLLSMWYSRLAANAGNINEGRTGWLVVQMVVYAGFSTILSLYSLVADTVLFVYCRALQGELAFQIDEKLGGEYVRLPFDDA